MEKELEEKGIIFKDTDSALRENEELFKEYFASVVPEMITNSQKIKLRVWSGGSFIYVPKNVKLDTPLQAYFRINSENMGQF